MEFHQGDTFYFELNFQQGTSLTYTSWDDFDNVFVYLYTGTQKILKFSKTTLVGYNQITRLNSLTLSCAVSSEQSLLLPQGSLKIEILCVDANNNGINVKNTEILIKPSNIKKEV